MSRWLHLLLFAWLLLAVLGYDNEDDADEPIDENAGICYRVTYGRGVGKVLQCDNRSRRPAYTAGLCYPKVIICQILTQKCKNAFKKKKQKTKKK